MVVTRCAWNVDKIKKALSLSRRQYVKLFTEILIASHWHVDEDERSTRNDNRDIDMECVHQLKHNEFKGFWHLCDCARCTRKVAQHWVLYLALTSIVWSVWQFNIHSLVNWRDWFGSSVFCLVMKKIWKQECGFKTVAYAVRISTFKIKEHS